MVTIPKCISAQWHDIKGNAKWDFIKFVAIAVSATPALIFKFVGRAPLWKVLVVLVVTTFCVAFLFCVIFWAIQKLKVAKPDSDASGTSFQPDEQSAKTFTTMVDQIKSKKAAVSGDIIKNYYQSLQPINPVGELITFSNEIRSEIELNWLCNEFEKHGYANALKSFKSVNDHSSSIMLNRTGVPAFSPCVPSIDQVGKNQRSNWFIEARKSVPSRILLLILDLVSFIAHTSQKIGKIIVRHARKKRKPTWIYLVSTKSTSSIPILLKNVKTTKNPQP